MDMAVLWNTVLSIALGLVGWNWVSMSKEVQRVTILLNRTREEMAKEYVTKAEVHADINRVIDRLEALDTKLDRFFETRK
jgi:exosome complex RNA-binding protein Rrp4